MKYCPQCNRQYTETWLTFCSNDGTMLIEELSPPVDPNWNPVIREPKVDARSEQETQWLPREPPMPGGWVAPDERPPMTPVWQPPPPPPQPFKKQSQGLAVASMVTGILGLILGCLGPLPGIAAIVLGWMALAQIKNSPDTTAGKPLAITGIVTGSLTVAFYGLLLIWIILAGAFGT
ncbi:MAG: hypothetical protein V7638_1529 [Acidobacteriota bacterium]|jgi:hypothetical protein